MDVFQIPIILKPQARKTIQAIIYREQCLIRFPEPWLKKKKYLLLMADQIYWRLLAQLYAVELKLRTAELNQRYFNFHYCEVRYHRQFRRWGSCSTLKNINLSHRLIGAPQHLRDYVILHELGHLKYLNHGREFWCLIITTGFQPKAIRKEIEQYGRRWQSSYYQWYQDLFNLITSCGN